MKSHYYAVLFAVCLLAGFKPGYAQPIITTAGSYNGPEGTIQIPVTVDNFIDVNSIALVLTYPSGYMTYQSYTANPALAGGFLIVNNNMPYVDVYAVWFGLTPVTLPAGSVLFTFIFIVTEGSGNLVWDTWTAGRNCQYYDILGNSLPAAWINGSILVSDGPAPPQCAMDPFPASGSTAYPAALTWSDGGGGTASYRVYFGTDNPPQSMVQDNSMTTYTPAGLLPSSQYYWKVVPYNSGGEAENCPVWSFTTPPCTYITGQITYHNNAATPLNDVQVQLKTTGGQLLQTATTDYQGNYTFCLVTPGDYMLTAASTSPAGGINAIDALIALRHYSELISLTGLVFKAADVNNSNHINSIDALMILRRYVELISIFPAGDWVFESNTVTITNGVPVLLNFKGLCYGDLDGSYTPAGCTPLPTPSDAGPDQNVTGTATNLAGNTPLSGTGEWSILSGTDGSVAEPGNPLSAFSGVAGNTYTLVWSITTICAASTDTVQITFTNPSFTCGSPFSDTRDGQVYNTVQIGTQCWMQQNLNIGTMVLSTTSGSSHSDCSNNGIIEKYCYNNDPANCTTYGGLYDWNEMMGYTTTPGVQGICPAGWHIPTDAEWCALSSFLDTNANCNEFVESYIAGGKLKDTGFTHWNSPNTGATNESGFTALGAGYRTSSGFFGNLDDNASFWSSSMYTASTSISRELYYGDDYLYRNEIHYKIEGLSVRCLSDEGTGCTPMPTTSDAGPDQNVTGTATNLAGNTPLSGTGEWSILSGTGGSVAQPGNPLSTFSGVAGNTYTLVWSITTICAASTDTVQITFTNPSFTCGSPFSDTRDGQVYNTVQIGTQCWMQQNLNIGTMVLSTTSGSSHSDCSNNGIIEKYCYNNDPANCTTYGGLYDWNEMMGYTTTPGVQGICPAGWHIPTDAEWCTLTTYLDPTVNCNSLGYSGKNAGGKMKETGFTHWASPNTGATNESGFTALAAGYRHSYGSFDRFYDYAYFWSSSESSTSNGRYRYLGYDYAKVSRYFTTKTYGFAVRCVRNF